MVEELKMCIIEVALNYDHEEIITTDITPTFETYEAYSDCLIGHCEAEIQAEVKGALSQPDSSYTLANSSKLDDDEKVTLKVTKKDMIKLKCNPELVVMKTQGANGKLGVLKKKKGIT